MQYFNIFDIELHLAGINLSNIGSEDILDLIVLLRIVMILYNDLENLSKMLNSTI